MAQDKDYSLITVNADEEDDIVIEAGVTAPVPAPASALVSPDGGGVGGSMAPDVGQAQGGLAPEGGQSQEASAAPEGDAAPTAPAATLHGDREAPRVASGMITTEEDLRAKMPFANMQRVIVALLVALMVVAGVYWFFLR